MKKIIIRIRDLKSGQITRSLIFKGDVSIIITSMKLITVVEHDQNHKETKLNLTDDEAFTINNWGVLL